MRYWSFTSCASGIDARCIDRSAIIGEILGETRPQAGPAVALPRLVCRRCLWTRGVQALHPQGVQEGVQKCGFVRGSRLPRNPMVAPCQFLPATNIRGTGPMGRSLLYWHVRCPLRRELQVRALPLLPLAVISRLDHRDVTTVLDGPVGELCEGPIGA